MTNVKKITFLSFMLAISIILSVVDSFIPTNIPGVKLGLANVVILIVLYMFSIKDAILINILRVYIASLLRGTILTMGFLMSLSGAFLSLLVMIILKIILKNKALVFVSVIGAVFHSVGQILVGVLYLESLNVFYYLPILVLISIATGLVMGIIAYKIINNKTMIRKVNEIKNPPR